jgi:tRNA threonylcarbamoyl adenosine modification protein YeaZ
MPTIMTGADPLVSLILETSTPRASIAVIQADGRGEFREFQSDRSHNAMLFQPLDELMRRAGPPVELVLVGSGPGSYSGTRVGIAAAQGVAIALGCPAVAVPSILAVPPADQGAKCLAIGDARRGGYWWAWVEDFQMADAPVLGEAATLLEAVKTAVEGGVPVFSFEDPARFPLPPEFCEIITTEFPDARRLWNAWQGAGPACRSRWSQEIPQPIYLKPPHITPGKRRSLLA